jgi:hypothetical protein
MPWYSVAPRKVIPKFFDPSRPELAAWKVLPTLEAIALINIAMPSAHRRRHHQQDKYQPNHGAQL